MEELLNRKWQLNKGLHLTAMWCGVGVGRGLPCTGRVGGRVAPVGVGCRSGRRGTRAEVSGRPCT